MTDKHSIPCMVLGTLGGLPLFMTAPLYRRWRMHWELGTSGIAVYGALWAVAAIGFVVAALAFWFGWGWWQSMMLAVTLLSLLLTVLDWNLAFTGVMVNLMNLAFLWFAPPLTTRVAR